MELFLLFSFAFSHETFRKILDTNPNDNTQTTETKLNTTPIIISAAVFIFVLSFFIIIISCLLYKKKQKLSEHQKDAELQENSVIPILTDVQPVTTEHITWTSEHTSDDPFNLPTSENGSIDYGEIIQKESESDFYIADTEDI